MSAADLLTVARIEAPEPPGLMTGLGRLDELTGGVRGGTAWLLTAAPQEGRSTLASQLALRSAVGERRPTWFVSPLTSSRWTAARLLSAQARIPLDRICGTEVLGSEQRRLSSARESIAASPMMVMTDQLLPDLDALVTAVAGHDALVVLDDVDEWAEDWTGWLDRLALRGTAVIATVTHESVVPRAPTSWQLDRVASRSAEVIVDVRTLEIPNWRLRPGEAELAVLQHRHGPLATISVAWQPYFARFVDLGTPAGNYPWDPDAHTGA